MTVLQSVPVGPGTNMHTKHCLESMEECTVHVLQYRSTGVLRVLYNGSFYNGSETTGRPDVGQRVLNHLQYSS
jgi:hypothetical protein